jgi:hypothetical protein
MSPIEIESSRSYFLGQVTALDRAVAYLQPPADQVATLVMQLLVDLIDALPQQTNPDFERSPALYHRLVAGGLDEHRAFHLLCLSPADFELLTFAVEQLEVWATTYARDHP